MSYVELLKDPRWQKKRLEVFERAGWKCQCCGNYKDTLHVHHLVYDGKEPWETEFKHLESLCEGCHQWREWWNEVMEGRSITSTLFCREFYRQVCQPLFTGQEVPSELLRDALIKRMVRWAKLTSEEEPMERAPEE